ncbi:MAG TPA: hypothetical protein VGJ18_22955 [Gemmatimonadaceae bacterium]|jgi:hypothetical protein
MSDDHADDRRRILDRANRMLNQSRTLRKLADELKEESGVIRKSAKTLSPKRRATKKRG